MDFFQPILSIIPGIEAVLLAIIPLGFLIFIHELGHFLAAKRAGIKVNTFSLGFGPKIFGFTRGETLYKLSLLPFGGYVAMEGENPTEQTGAEGEFGSASLGNRAFVVIAGPVVNLLFGILAFWFIFTVGLDADSAEYISRLTGQSFSEEQEAVQIGMIADDGPAAVAGVKPGDTIVSLDGTPITNWNVFHTKIFTNPEKEMELIIERNGEQETLTVTPDALPSGPRGDQGVLQVSSTSAAFVSNVDEGSLAAEAGIKVGDQIETINGQKIYTVPQFGPGIWDPRLWFGTNYQSLYQQINENKTEIEIGVTRSVDKETYEKLTITMPVTWEIKTAVQEKSTADKAGLKDGDVLIRFNGNSVDSKSLFSEMEMVGDDPIVLGILREGTEQTVTLIPAKASTKDDEDTFFGIGWLSYLSGMRIGRSPLPKYNVLTAIGKGFETTWLTLTSITRTLKQLISGEVSPKYLSGPVGIADATSRMFDSVGLTTVLFFIGFISINLAIVNLLPIPIADGGHLLFFAVEKIRGQPVPRRAQEIVQQVSVILLIALFLYITWFDSITLFHSWFN